MLRYINYCGGGYLLLLIILCSAIRVNGEYSLQNLSTVVNTTSGNDTTSSFVSPLPYNLETNCSTDSHSPIHHQEELEEMLCSSFPLVPSELPFHHIDTALYVGYLGSAYVNDLGREVGEKWNDDPFHFDQEAYLNSTSNTTGSSTSISGSSSRLSFSSFSTSLLHSHPSSPAVLLSLSRRYYLSCRDALFFSTNMSQPSWISSLFNLNDFTEGTELPTPKTSGQNSTNDHSMCRSPWGPPFPYLKEEEEEEEDWKEMPPLLAFLKEASSRWGLEHVQFSSCGGQWRHVWSTSDSLTEPSSTRVHADTLYPHLHGFQASESPSSSSPLFSSLSRSRIHTTMPSFDDVVHLLSNHAECTLPSVSICGRQNRYSVHVGRTSTRDDFDRHDGEDNNDGGSRHAAAPPACPSTAYTSRPINKKNGDSPLHSTRRYNAEQAMSFVTTALLGYSAEPLFSTGPSIRFFPPGSSIASEQRRSGGLPGQPPSLWQPFRTHFFYTSPSLVRTLEDDFMSDGEGGDVNASFKEERNPQDTLLSLEATKWCSYEEVPSGGGPLCSSLLSRLLGEEEGEDEEEEKELRERTHSSSSSSHGLPYQSRRKVPPHMMPAEKEFLLPFRMLFGPWNNPNLFQQPYYELSIRLERRRGENADTPFSSSSFCSSPSSSIHHCGGPSTRSSVLSSLNADGENGDHDADAMLEVRLSTVVDETDWEEVGGTRHPSTPSGHLFSEKLGSWAQHWGSEKVQTLLHELYAGGKHEGEWGEHPFFTIHVGPRGAPSALLAPLSPWIRRRRRPSPRGGLDKEEWNTSKFRRSFSPVTASVDDPVDATEKKERGETTISQGEEEVEERVDEFQVPGTFFSISSCPISNGTRTSTQTNKTTPTRTHHSRVGSPTLLSMHTEGTGSSPPPSVRVKLFDMYVRMTALGNKGTSWGWRRSRGRFSTSSSARPFFSLFGRPIAGIEVGLYEVFLELEFVLPCLASVAPSSSFLLSSVSSRPHSFILTTWISFPLGVIHPFLQHFPLPPGAYQPASTSSGNFEEGGGEGRRFFSFSSLSPLAPSSSSYLSGKKQFWVEERCVPTPQAEKSSHHCSQMGTRNHTENEPNCTASEAKISHGRRALVEVMWKTALVESKVEGEEKRELGAGMHEVMLATTVETVVIRTEEGEDNEQGTGTKGLRHRRMDIEEINCGKNYSEENEERSPVRFSILPEGQPHLKPYHDQHTSSSRLRRIKRKRKGKSAPTSPQNSVTRVENHRRRKQTIPIRIAAIPYIPVWPSTRHAPPSRYSAIRLPSPHVVVLETSEPLPFFSVWRDEKHSLSKEGRGALKRKQTATADSIIDVPLESFSPLFALANNICPLLQCRGLKCRDDDRRWNGRGNSGRNSWAVEEEEEDSIVGDGGSQQNIDHPTHSSPHPPLPMRPLLLPSSSHDSSASFQHVHVTHMDHEEVLLRLLSDGGICSSVLYFLSLWPKEDENITSSLSFSPLQTTNITDHDPFPYSDFRTFRGLPEDCCAFSEKLQHVKYVSLSTRRVRGKPMVMLHTFDEDIALKAPILYIFIFFVALPIIVIRILTFFFVL